MAAPLPPERDHDVLESSPGWGRAVSLLARVPRWLMLAVTVLLLAGGAWLAVHGRTAGHTRGTAGPTTGKVLNGISSQQAEGLVVVPASCAQYDNASVSHVPRGFRTVFGDVAVPPAHLPVGVSAPGELWGYGAKTGFYYRGEGPPVTISVPARWQRQIGLFGPANGIDGTARTLHIPRCPPDGSSWDGYASEFYLSTPTACAPLDVRVGRRTARFWFGLGARCPAGVDTGPRISVQRAGQAP